MKLLNEAKSYFMQPLDLRATKIDLGHPSQFKEEQWVNGTIGVGSSTHTGVSVTELSALRCTAVLKCVRILSESIASLPLFVYERQRNGGKTKAMNHPLFPVLHDLANPLTTSFTWRETLMGHLALWGNAYSEIERDGRGRILALWQLRPDMMRLEADGLNIRYFYTVPSGQEKEISADNVFHICGLSANGYQGQSVIAWARESIGLKLASEEFLGRFFSNDATPNAVITHPGVLSDKARKNIKQSFDEEHRGLSKKHRYEILEEGMKLDTIGMPLEDAQFLEIMKYNDLDIAGIYRIPAHMVNNLERATFSNIEHQSIEFVVHTLRPWLVRWEQAIKRDMFFGAEKLTHFAEYMIDGLLRGDQANRAKALSIQWEHGVISSDEWRAIENMNPIEGGQGQKYYVPMNFAPVGTPIEPSQAQRTNGHTQITEEDYEQGENEESHIS